MRRAIGAGFVAAGALLWGLEGACALSAWLCAHSARLLSAAALALSWAAALLGGVRRCALRQARRR
jgi:hypothetical protein